MKNFNVLLDDVKNDFLKTFLEGKILALGFAMASVMSFIKTFLFADTRYLVWLLIAILFDIFAKLYNLWYIEKKKPDLRVLVNKTVEKTLKYAIYLVITFVVVNFEVNGKKVDFLSVGNVFIYGILIVKECISVLENIGMKLPKPLQDVIDKQFNIEKDDTTEN